MRTEFNKGRASEILDSIPTDGTRDQILVWLMRSITFLLSRYIDET